jgi:GNAT-family acetyltransferase (TIGR03103 family)
MATSERGGRPPGYEDANKYTQVIIDEAIGRGIDVVILDPSIGELELSRGERRIRTIESLSELTHAVAFRRCDDKLLTRRVLMDAGLHVPPGRVSTSDADDVAFLRHHGEIVVKPRRGEQGWGVTVGVVDEDGLVRAVAAAREVADDVLLERCHHGADLRIVVIGGEVVAASERRPPRVTGDGRQTVAELVVELGEARARATHGAANLALDDLTRDVVAAAGHSLDDVLPDGAELTVRRTANVHTGGTIDDVTDELHPELGAVAVRAAAALDIPVLGLDLIVPSPSGTEYVIIEGNEQPGLANHEPRPTVQRFVDLLFPD